MNKLSILAVGALWALASPAHAVVINLGVFPQPAGGSSPADQMNYLNTTVLPQYNAANDPDLTSPAIATGGNLDVQVPGGGSSLSVNVTSFEYLKIKWGNFWQYYAFTGNESGSLTFNQPLGPGGVTTGGASHYDLWHSQASPPGDVPPVGVPDGGTTIAMLGLGLSLLAFMRRKLA
jgi:hypothetical protein